MLLLTPPNQNLWHVEFGELSGISIYISGISYLSEDTHMIKVAIYRVLASENAKCIPKINVIGNKISVIDWRAFLKSYMIKFEPLS